MRFTSRAAAVLTLAVVTTALRGQAAETDVKELRQKADALERKAQELKSDGEGDRANAVMRQVDEIRAQIQRTERQEESGEQPRSRPEEMRREMQRAQAAMKEQLAAERQERAMDLRRQMQKLEDEKARLRRAPEGEGRPVRERAMMASRRGATVPPPDAEQRLRHLQVAIENLHAAGMHEPADQLARQAEAMRQSLERPGLARPPLYRPEVELEQLRAEVGELRRAVRELRARIDRPDREEK